MRRLEVDDAQRQCQTQQGVMDEVSTCREEDALL